MNTSQQQQPSSYTASAVWVHWVSVLLLVGMMITGLQMEEAPDDANKALLLQIHVWAGLLTSIVSIYRFFQYRNQKRDRQLPVSLSSGAKWINVVKSVIHGALRYFMLLLSFTGIMILFTSGLYMVAFTGDAEYYSEIKRNFLFPTHGIPSKIYILLGIIHIIGLLRFLVVKKENVLKRMWWGSKSK